jgi:hypothetical protein
LDAKEILYGIFSAPLGEHRDCSDTVKVVTIDSVKDVATERDECVIEMDGEERSDGVATTKTTPDKGETTPFYFAGSKPAHRIVPNSLLLWRLTALSLVINQ